MPSFLEMSYFRLEMIAGFLEIPDSRSKRNGSRLDLRKRCVEQTGSRFKRNGDRFDLNGPRDEMNFWLHKPIRSHLGISRSHFDIPLSSLGVFRPRASICFVPAPRHRAGLAP